jgi:FixJ family two-component response regulator
LPIVFVTGHGNIPMCVRAMNAGAVDFLLKPFNDEELLKIITRALNKGRTLPQGKGREGCRRQ